MDYFWNINLFKKIFVKRKKNNYCFLSIFISMDIGLRILLFNLKFSFAFLIQWIAGLYNIFNLRCILHSTGQQLSQHWTPNMIQHSSSCRNESFGFLCAVGRGGSYSIFFSLHRFILVHAVPNFWFFENPLYMTQWFYLFFPSPVFYSVPSLVVFRTLYS